LEVTTIQILVTIGIALVTEIGITVGTIKFIKWRQDTMEKSDEKQDDKIEKIERELMAQRKEINKRMTREDCDCRHQELKDKIDGASNFAERADHTATVIARYLYETEEDENKKKILNVALPEASGE